MSADDARRAVLRTRFGDAVKLNGELARSEALRKALAEYWNRRSWTCEGWSTHCRKLSCTSSCYGARWRCPLICRVGSARTA